MDSISSAKAQGYYLEEQTTNQGKNNEIEDEIEDGGG